MKFYLSFIIIAICCNVAANGQQNLFQNNEPLDKGNSPTYYRQIATANFVYDGTRYVPTDSITFSYTYGRRYDIQGNMCYDACMHWIYTQGAYKLQGRNTQNFDDYGYIATRDSQTYDQGIGHFNNYSRSVFTCDKAGDLMKQMDLKWDPGRTTWDSVGKMDLAYFTSIGFRLAYILQYSWNAGHWDYASISDFTYDYKVRLNCNTFNNINSGQFARMPVYRDSTNYNPPGSVNYKKKEIYIDSTNQWVGKEKLVNLDYDTYAGFNKFITQTWNDTTQSFENLWLDSAWFNSDNLKYCNTQVKWTSSGNWVLDKGCKMSRFYYESYTPADPNTPAPTVSFSIYPNPADNYIDIQFSTKNASNTRVSILDMTGRTVAIIGSANFTDGYNSLLWSVAELRQGDYLLQFDCDGNRVSKKFSVRR